MQLQALTPSVSQLVVNQTLPGVSAQRVQDSVKINQQVLFGSAGTVAPDHAYLKTLESNGILVAGANGIMGNGIAQNAATNNVPVYLQEFNDDFAKASVGKMQAEVTKAVTRGLMTKEAGEALMARVKGTVGNVKDSMDKVPENIGLVIEAILENMDAKKDFFQKMDGRLNKDAILASNTSSLSISEMAASLSPERQKKFVGLHYFKPAHKNRFIEIIKGANTSEDTVQKTMAFVRAMGKVAIVCNDAPGFVVNRLGIPLINEGTRMLEEGLGNTSTIDRVAFETLWPTVHKKMPDLAGKVLLPFGGLNQDNYMLVLGLTTQVLDKGLKHLYGASYQPTKTILDKMSAYQNIEKQARAEKWSKQQFDDALKATKFDLSGAVDETKKAAIRDRFLGMVFGVAGQLIDEGVTTREDVDRGVRVGLGWEVGPYELMNKIGVDKALKLVEAYAAKTPGFKVPDVIKAQAKSRAPFALNLVDSRTEGTTRYISINRPQMLNAVDPATVENIRSAFRAAEADASIKTIVFESAGGKSFIAGADLNTLQNSNIELMKKLKSSFLGKIPGAPQLIPFFKVMRPFLLQGKSLMNEVANSQKVTVSKVNGIALGGGTEMALACDYVVASDKAVFGLPEVKYGIYPAWGGTERLARKIGKPLARWMIFEGGHMSDKGAKGDAILSGTDAAAVGIADKVVAHADLDRTVSDLMKSGAFKTKPAKAGKAPDTVKGTRFEEKAKRYANANLDDLMTHELKGLYRPAIELAQKMIDRNCDSVWTTTLLKMATNMQKVSAKAAKAKTSKKSL